MDPIHPDLGDGARVERRPVRRIRLDRRGYKIEPPTGSVRLERVAGPNLNVESGRLVVGDAKDGIQTGDVLSRRVPCGEHASETIEFDCPQFGRVVALFVLRFSRDTPTRWRHAGVVDYRWWRRFLPGSSGYLRFGVDFGLVGVADANISRALRQMVHMGDDVLEHISEQFEKSGRTVLRPATSKLPEGQFLVCASGSGDGVFCGYWGFSRSGQVACLMLDFGCIAFPDSMECEPG